MPGHAPDKDGAWRRESKCSDKGSGHKTLIPGTTAFEVQEKETQTFSSSILQQRVYWVCLKKKVKKRKEKPKELHRLPYRMLYAKVQNQNYFGHWISCCDCSRARRLYV